MVVGRALLWIAEDFIGANDLPEFQRRIGIVRPQIGVGAFDGCAERAPQTFGVIVWQGPKQIVKRIHDRSRRWISSSPTEIPAANLLGSTRTNSTSLPVDNVGSVRQKNDLSHGLTPLGMTMDHVAWRRHAANRDSVVAQARHNQDLRGAGARRRTGLFLAMHGSAQAICPNGDNPAPDKPAVASVA
jgi:hypothetical protein